MTKSTLLQRQSQRQIPTTYLAKGFVALTFEIFGLYQRVRGGWRCHGWVERRRR